MKKHVYKLLTVLILATIGPNVQIADAQDSLNITESVETMSQGKQNGFQIIIPKNSAKSAESLWKKFMKEETKTSIKKEYNEMVVHNASMKSFGSDAMNVYAAFKDSEGRAYLSAFISGADSVFISSSRDEAKSISAKLMIRNFAIYAYKDGVSDELKEETKKMEKVEKELKGLEKDISSSEKQIKKNQREIERQKDDIKALQTQEEFTSSEVLKQKQLLTTFSGSPEARKVDEKKLKSLEKEKKKVTRNIEKANRKIDKLEDQIKNSEKAIDKNKNKFIPEKKEELNSQKETVKKIDDLLNSIR